MSPREKVRESLRETDRKTNRVTERETLGEKQIFKGERERRKGSRKTDKECKTLNMRSCL